MGKTIHKIEHEEEIGIVEAVWYSAASQEDLKQALSFGLMVHEQTHCPYRLEDITSLSGLWADLGAWLEEDWLPCACRAGIRYVAYIASLSSSGEAAGAAHPLDSIGSLIEVRFFTDRENALNWLKNKQTGGL
ncbi:hypothetical protein [Pontibacter diazotrophicus]|uniref:hypothetical protein n=1 Tax=Pontibacter diazotrophicus TaxID=1400979 RepID=UPI0011C01A52|nr:hypothetical protein [Pontibacter diazotrophicus]